MRWLLAGLFLVRYAGCEFGNPYQPEKEPMPDVTGGSEGDGDSACDGSGCEDEVAFCDCYDAAEDAFGTCYADCASVMGPNCANYKCVGDCSVRQREDLISCAMLSCPGSTMAQECARACEDPLFACLDTCDADCEYWCSDECFTTRNACVNACLS